MVPQYSIPRNQLPLYAQQVPPAQSRLTPTGYPNQASYLSLMENQSFDKSTPVEGGDIEQISQPSKQTKSNIPPATITKDTTLAAIFPFDIDNLNTHSLFSGAAINQDKPITALYTNTRVGEIDIKLILDSRSAHSIITKQLMDQLDYATTVWIITVDWNTKTPIGEIDNFPFKINGIQIPIKVFVIKATQYQALYVQVPATCRHFKTQRTEELLIEFEDTSMPPTIKTYQVLWADDYQTELPPPPIWKEKRKGRAEEESNFYQPPRLICVDVEKNYPLWMHVSGTTKNGPPPPNTIAGLVYWKDLDDQNDKTSGTTHHASHVVKSCQIKDSGMMCLAEEEHATRLMPKYTGPDYPKNDFFTDNPDVFQNRYQELAPTREEQEQRLADLNTKLCDYCLIPCYFQYYDECDLIFNPPPRILFPITELPEPEEEVLITEDMSFQDPTEDTKTEHLAKKKIDIKEGIIDAGYTGNIIVMLQNNLNRPYKIESQEKIAQAIFLPLVKIPQLTLITTQKELGLTA
ncbi:hypothetical protein G9A89_020179 [Geosiphon pyriformis]|nr:hypothetical protein G9A89_020179 [Geosiphon pyriformis]